MHAPAGVDRLAWAYMVALFLSGTGALAQPAESIDDQLTSMERGSIAELRTYLANGSASATDALGRTALMAVAQWRQRAAEGARLLLDAGAAVNAQDKNGETALSRAAYRADVDLVHLLLDRGADPTIGHVLHDAVFTWSRPDPGNARETVRALLAAGALADGCDRDGRRALQMAAMRPQGDEVVDLLIDSGADPDAPDPVTGNTPLQWAAAVGSIRTVELLLAAGTPVDARNAFDCSTALHRAAGNGHTAVVDALVRAGAQVNPTDRTAATPLATAEARGATAAAALLREHGGRLATLPTASCEDQAGKARRPCGPRPGSHKAAATEVAGDFEGALAFVQNAVRDWGEAHAALLAPEIAQEIASGFGYTIGMLCTAAGGRPADAPASSCRSLLAPGDHLRQLVTGYLDDTLLARRNEVESPFSRFANSLIPDADARMGYPRHQPNRSACVELGPASQTRLPVLGASVEPTYPVARMCALPGDYDLDVVRDGRPRVLRVSISPQAATSTDGESAQAQTAVVLSRLTPYCSESAEARPHPMAAWAGRDAPPGDPAAAGAFASATAGQIAIEDPGGWCPPACRRRIALAALAAAQVWKGACEACVPFSLSAVRADGVIFLERSLLDRLLLAHDLDSALSSAEPISEEGSLFLNRFSVGGPRPRKAFPPFIRVDPLSGLGKAICTRLETGKSNPTKDLHALLCKESRSPDASPATLRIQTVSGVDCIPNAIACATVQQGLQLNGGGFRFSGPSESGSEQYGAGNQLVDLEAVLVHEVGHWFGLPHLDDPAPSTDGRLNAMYPTLTVKGLCVTQSNLQMLDNVGRGHWYFRQTDCAGLSMAPTKGMR